MEGRFVLIIGKLIFEIIVLSVISIFGIVVMYLMVGIGNYTTVLFFSRLVG